MQEVVHVSELLEIPTVVASTDLVGVFASSMERITRVSLGLQVLPLPIELPAVPIYMTWHEARRNDAGHKWLREMVAAELSRSAPHLEDARGHGRVAGPADEARRRRH